MEFNLACVLRWTIYILAALTVVMAIATIAIDQNDNSAQKNDANKGEGGSYTNKTGSNFILFFLMLASAGFAVAHYFWPRLFLIVLMGLFGMIVFILRLFLPHHSHFELIFVVPLNASVGIFYIFWVGFHEKSDKEESVWKTMTKVDVHGGSAPAAGTSGTHLHQKSFKKKSSKKTVNA